MKHTQGKWIYVGGLIICNCPDGSRVHIAEPKTRPLPPSEIESNAKLIASVVPFFEFLCGRANHGCVESQTILKEQGYAKGEDY